MRCMLFNMDFPKSVVIASHLFPRKLEKLCNTLFGFEDLDDVRNGLLLFRPLEAQCDRFNISFIPANDGNVRLKVVNSQILKATLWMI